jgi:hypothetical protein
MNMPLSNVPLKLDLSNILHIDGHIYAYYAALLT